MFHGILIEVNDEVRLKESATKFADSTPHSGGSTLVHQSSADARRHP